MSVKPIVPLDPEVRAHRRWLITIAITVMFGGFGAVMAYLSYVNNSKSAVSSPGRSRSPSKSPATAPTVAPPAAEPSAPAPSDQEKGDSGDN